MTYGTLCSGIEAPTLAWDGLGWHPQWFTEIDPFASAVLAHHYPGIPNHGDINDVTLPPVGLICGGTPCQDFSIAGNREGMAGERSGLALRFLEIVDELQPSWIVWENVPGCLSTNGGKDFGAFLGGMGECGYGFAYRVLNAQYYGVPQRRRRVFVVGYLGDWRPAAAVLFEQHSLQRHSAPSRGEGERPATGPGEGVETEKTDVVYENHPADSRIKEVEVCPSINRKFRNQSDVPLVQRAHGRRKYTESTEAGPDRASYQKQGDTDLVATYWDGGQTSDCIDASQVKKQQAMPEKRRFPAVLEPVPIDMQNVTRDPDKKDHMNRQGVGIGESGDPSPTLTSTVHAVASLEPLRRICLGQQFSVRRLTPIECERLMGMPDNYTKIPYRGKTASQCPDSPRYASIGNSIAVPVLGWIGKRIAGVQKMLDTRVKKA